jgi:hypothetical protein
MPAVVLPGDETAALMLPAAPEFSRLPEAFAAAASRFTGRPSPIVTFVDPLTGQRDDDTAPGSGGDPGWRLVDEWRDSPDNIDPGDGIDLNGVLPARIPGARINWDSHPP